MACTDEYPQPACCSQSRKADSFLRHRAQSLLGSHIHLHRTGSKRYHAGAVQQIGTPRSGAAHLARQFLGIAVWHQDQPNPLGQHAIKSHISYPYAHYLCAEPHKLQRWTRNFSHFVNNEHSCFLNSTQFFCTLLYASRLLVSPFCAHQDESMSPNQRAIATYQTQLSTLQAMHATCELAISVT